MKIRYSMLTLLLTYFTCLLMVFIFQRKLIYFPQKFSLSEQITFADQYHLTLWPHTKDYRGLISQSKITKPKGTVIVFNGNAGSANSRLFYLSALEKLGYRVILAEYPGYGARPGKLSEEDLVADAVKTVQLAYIEFGAPIFLWGESLGSGVVAGIIQHNKTPIHGISLMTPFDSLANTAQHHYGLFLAKWLILDKYDNIKNLQNYTGNIAVIQANQDQIIPNKRTQKLFASLIGNKRMWEFEQAGHNTIPISDELIWWQETMAFIVQ